MARPIFFLILILMIGFAGWRLAPAGDYGLKPGQPAAEIAGGLWINSRPLTLSELRGKVVLVDFWTYG